MPRYIYTIEFDADDDDEAEDIIWNERYGVTNSFSSIRKEDLSRDGEIIKSY